MKLKTIILAATVAALASCGSSKKAAEATSTDILQSSTTTSAVTSQNTSAAQQTVTPVITVSQFISDLDLSVGFGSDHYNLGGKIAMKRDKVVRMNLTFMGFIEVGIIEFTPDYMLVVNRMGKQFTKASYDSIDALKQNNINFQTVEAMAWEKLYPKDGKKLKDSELDSTIENLINSNIKGGNKVSVHIEVGKPNTTKDFETYTEVKSSYKEVPATLLMSQLMNFAK